MTTQLIQRKGTNRLWVALRVSKVDIRKGIQAKKPGIYLFGGFWYGKNPQEISSFGKMMSLKGKVVGKIHSKPSFSQRRKIF